MSNKSHRNKKHSVISSNMMHLLGGDSESNILNIDQINNDFLNRLSANTDDEDDEKFNFNMSKDPNMSKYSVVFFKQDVDSVLISNKSWLLKLT